MDPTRQKRWLKLLIAAWVVLAAVGITAGVMLLRQTEGPRLQRTSPATATVVKTGPAIANVTMTTHHGTEFDRSDFRGRWSLIFFGFTHCPDVCPTTMGMLQAVWDHLGAVDPALRQQTQVIFVSVDPQRDTRERLTGFMERFDPAFLALRATEPTLSRFTDPLGVHHQVTTGPSPHAGHQGVQIDHSPGVYLVGPDARVRQVFTPPHRPKELVDGLRRLAAEAP